MGKFIFYETHTDGTPTEKPKEIPYNSAFRTLALLCPKLDVYTLQYYIDLACVAPGNWVDLTKFDDNAMLIWSARMKYVEDSSES